MFGNRWRLFRLLGIPISVDASWLIILAPPDPESGNRVSGHAPSVLPGSHA